MSRSLLPSANMAAAEVCERLDLRFPHCNVEIPGVFSHCNVESRGFLRWTTLSDSFGMIIPGGTPRRESAGIPICAATMQDR